MIGLGAGGHAKVVLDILSFCPQYRVLGLLDPDQQLWGKEMLGVRVLGGDELLPKLRAECEHAFVAIGSVRTASVRRRVFEAAIACGFSMLNTVHPRACVAGSAQLGQGISIMASAVVNPGSVVGQNVIINSGAIVEHDCTIEDHVHIAPGARLAGNVHVGRESHVGIGAIILEGRRIGSNTVIGGGAVVTKDLPDRVIAAGVPARVLGSS